MALEKSLLISGISSALAVKEHGNNRLISLVVLSQLVQQTDSPASTTFTEMMLENTETHQRNRHQKDKILGFPHAFTNANYSQDSGLFQ